MRENDWQWGVTVQQEVMPRVSVEVGYARRWFKGVTRDRQPDRDAGATTTRATITAPSDPRLPDGGGYPITLYRGRRPAAATAGAELHHVRDRLRSGARPNYWHGVDFTLNARTPLGADVLRSAPAPAARSRTLRDRLS